MEQLPFIIQRFIEATNAGNSGWFMSAFAKNACLNDQGTTYYGSDPIENWNRRRNIGLQTKLELLDTQPLDTTIWRVRLQVSQQNAAYVCWVRFTIVDGAIQSVEIKPSN